jgi:hypothetical protein
LATDAMIYAAKPRGQKPDRALQKNAAIAVAA